MTARPLSVGDLLEYLKQVLSFDPVLADVWVTGEVVSASLVKGHLYFTVADDEGRLKAALFRGNLVRQQAVPHQGMQVALHGRIDVYAPRGELQIIVDSVQPAGLGLAALEFERLRAVLEAEGLFDPARKRPIPAMPRCIGVVTSREGAVWHDIQRVVARRYPLVELVLSPCRVQGVGSEATIVRALDALQRDGRCDVIILARGGGSPDDLAAFNTEAVARAVFSSRVPVVSGVGHETDTTLVDFVADLRAPTPSAAAELCTPSATELREQVCRLRGDLATARQDALDAARGEQVSLRLALASAGPAARLPMMAGEIALRRSALGTLCRGQIERQATGVAGARDMLRALNPSAVLGRGYAALSDAATGSPIARAADARPGTALHVDLVDGSLTAGVEDVVVVRAMEDGSRP